MKYLVFIFILLVLPTILSAQEDTIHLEDVAISVTPFSERLSEATGSLSILPANEPTDAALITMTDIINQSAGVTMSSGTYTTNRITIRGIGSRTPYSSNRIKAYLEEIPLTSGDGVTTIEDLDITNLSRIEIIKGPASAMYGSGLGGVIKLKGNVPNEPGFSSNIMMGTGSFNTWRYSVHADWKRNNTAITAGISGARSNGFRENNQYKRNQLFLQGNTIVNRNRFNWVLLATNLYAEIPSSLNESDFNIIPFIAAPNWLAVNGHEKNSGITAGGSWNLELNDRWENHLVIFATANDPFESRPFNILDDQSFRTGIREFLKFKTDRFELAAGTELFNEVYNWKIFETISGTKGAMQLDNHEQRRYLNLFAHMRWYPVDRLIIETGANFNVLNYDLETLYNIAGVDQSGSYSYNPVLSPRIGINYSLDKNHHLHLSAGHGFSAPSLEETLLPEGQVNPDLLPETGWNLDAGLRGWGFNRYWYYDISGYTIFLSNMLVTKRISEEIFSGINAGSAQLSGIEFNNRIDFADPRNQQIEHTLLFSFFFNKNHFKEFIDDENDYSGNELPGIPARSIYAGYHFSLKKKLKVHLDLFHQGSQYMNDSNDSRYPGHTLLNSKIAYRLAFKNSPAYLRIQLGINNILNITYASMILVNAPSFGGDPRYYYPGMPQNIYLSLQLEI